MGVLRKGRDGTSTEKRGRKQCQGRAAGLLGCSVAGATAKEEQQKGRGRALSYGDVGIVCEPVKFLILHRTRRVLWTQFPPPSFRANRPWTNSCLSPRKSAWLTRRGNETDERAKGESFSGSKGIDGTRALLIDETYGRRFHTSRDILQGYQYRFDQASSQPGLFTLSYVSPLRIRQED